MKDVSAAVVQPDFEKYASDAMHIDFEIDFTDAFRSSATRTSGWFIDVGAGDGAVLQSAFEQKLIGHFDRVTAFDVSDVRIARLRNRNLACEADVVAADGLPLPDASIDYALSHQVIEHVPDDEAFVAEIARVLKPGAYAFVTSVSKRWYGWYFYRCNGKFRLDPTHVREYESLEAFRRLFDKSGFEVVSAVERRLGHPIRYLVVLVLSRLRLYSLAGATTFVNNSPLLRHIGRFEIPIPGYRYVEVLARKSVARS